MLYIYKYMHLALTKLLNPGVNPRKSIHDQFKISTPQGVETKNI